MKRLFLIIESIFIKFPIAAPSRSDTFSYKQVFHSAFYENISCTFIYQYPAMYHVLNDTKLSILIVVII